jgi:ankyrin repeat protein
MLALKIFSGRRRIKDYDIFNSLCESTMKKINQCIPQYNRELKKMLKKQVARALQFQDGLGNTILHTILCYSMRALQHSTKEVLNTCNVIRTFINLSKYSSGKSCLTVVNHEGNTPMHYIIRTKNSTVIKTFLTENAKELAACSWNKYEKFDGHCPSEPLPKPFSKSSFQRKLYINRPRNNIRIPGVEHFMVIPDDTKNSKPMNLFQTMLFYYSSSECIYLLEQLGICDINALANMQCSRSGNYPLHFLMYSYARTNRKRGLRDEMLELAQNLIDRGADVTVRNTQGYTPLAMLVYTHELFSCYINKLHTLDMIKLLMENTIEDLLNDRFPAYDSTVVYVILHNWTFSKSLITWMVTEGRAVISSEILSRISKDYKVVPSVGEKLRLLEKLGIDMRVDKEQIANRNLALKEIYYMPTKPPRVPKHPHKKDIHFWNDLLFEKHFGMHDKL